MKIMTHHLRRTSARTTFFSLAATILVTSCAVAPPTIVRETVGPQVAVANSEGTGYLTVYSASIWTSGEDLTLLTHTDYDIQNLDGSLFTRVINGADEEPARVTLPAGRYIVVAESDTAGTIRVPVAVETGRMTAVHLERKQDSDRAFAGIDSAGLVRLPDGQAIGVRVRHTESSQASGKMLASSNHYVVPLAQPKS